MITIITGCSLKSKLLFFQLLAGICLALPQQGVKSGHYYQPANFDNNNQAGTCYKRVPYHEALAIYNKTGSIPYRGYRPQWNNTYDNGYVTILDCCDGYNRNPSTNQCEYAPTSSSDCRSGCFGGRCISGQCTCDSGWYPVEGVCKPICRRPCGENAYCFSPEVCECKLGFERDSPQGVCRPVCPGGCVNGDCIAPHVCQCRPGYTLNATRERCDAVCEGGCQNGVCAAPGVCSCNPGFRNPPGERELCVQDCGPCEHGRCVSGGYCECNPGYRKDPASETCVPECRTSCPVNGHCVAPDRCECYSGYRLDYASNRCVPNYQPGGYQPGDYRPGDYQPGDYRPGNQGGYRPTPPSGNPQDCDRPCVNGVCMGYNICSCNNGYVPDPDDFSRTRCIPNCPGGCPNGVCSSPNFCICKPGFVKERGVKGSQRCIPQYK